MELQQAGGKQGHASFFLLCFCVPHAHKEQLRCHLPPSARLTLACKCRTAPAQSRCSSRSPARGDANPRGGVESPSQRQVGAPSNRQARPTCIASKQEMPLTGTLHDTQDALEGTRNSPSAQAVHRWLPLAASSVQLVHPGARQRTHCPRSRPKPAWHSTHAAGLAGKQRAQFAPHGWHPEGPTVKPRRHAAPAGASQAAVGSEAGTQRMLAFAAPCAATQPLHAARGSQVHCVGAFAEPAHPVQPTVTGHCNSERVGDGRARRVTHCRGQQAKAEAPQSRRVSPVPVRRLWAQRRGSP